MGDDITTHDGVTRREALKKGARLGGALVWAIPVVQTVGMSSAMAQTVSEGNCCLELRISAAEVGDGNDIEVTASVRNCGTLDITAIAAVVDRRVDGGAWELAIATLQVAVLGAGDPGSASVTRTNRPTGTYQYRAKGSFTCGGVTFDQHTVPGSEFVESNIVVIP